MTHFIKFISWFVGIAAYFIFAYRYWLKKDGGDKANAAIDVLASFIVMILVVCLSCGLWMATK
jgi:hypothetical protein